MARMLLLVAVGMYCMSPAAAHERQRSKAITHVKGFEGRLPFYLETGYVEVDDTHGTELFYYFIESERSPRDDPLILWITGGPGCSGLSSLLFEMGPLRLDVAGYTEGFPRLVYSEDSWTKVSNIIFVDAPVGTGFSYAREQQGLNVSLTGTGAQLRVFLERWLADYHPELASSPLYVGGDSYSGYTVPVTAVEIANGDLNLQLQGYLVGNPATDAEYDDGGKLPFLRGMGLISDELYDAAQVSCGNDKARCADALQAISLVTADINTRHVLEPKCADELQAMISPVTIKLGLPVDCRANGYRLSNIWANDAEVREALGIRDGSVDGKWSRCATLTGYRDDDVPSAIPYHANLTRRGYKALVYSGDHDLITITFVGTQAWIRTLGYPVVAPWRPWYSNHQVAGFTTRYAYNLTFATVKGAGHTAPEYRPKQCLDMIDRWTSLAGKL